MDKASLFSVSCCYVERSDCLKPGHRKFCTNVQKNFFTVRFTEHWNRLPREVVDIWKIWFFPCSFLKHHCTLALLSSWAVTLVSSSKSYLMPIFCFFSPLFFFFLGFWYHGVYFPCFPNILAIKKYMCVCVCVCVCVCEGRLLRDFYDPVIFEITWKNKAPESNNKSEVIINLCVFDIKLHAALSDSQILRLDSSMINYFENVKGYWISIFPIFNSFFWTILNVNEQIYKKRWLIFIYFA